MGRARPVEPVPAQLGTAGAPLTPASPGVPAATPPASTTGPAPGDPGVTPAGGASSSGELVVDVAGKVRRPGIVVLSPGARVADALEAAGGARPGVDLTPLNLARPLVDGEQILVGVEAPTGPAASILATPEAGGTTGTLVNINTADQAELETLPEVGPVTATAIITWRETNGGFTSVDELLEVDGIGEATLAQVAPHVTI